MVQIWIYGDSLRDFIIGVIVLDPERLKKYADDNGRNMYEDPSLLEDLKPIINADLVALATSKKLNSLEKPKQLILRTEAFSVENEFLTPTFKIKRNVAK